MAGRPHDVKDRHLDPYADRTGSPESRCWWWRSKACRFHQLVWGIIGWIRWHVIQGQHGKAEVTAKGELSPKLPVLSVCPVTAETSWSPAGDFVGQTACFLQPWLNGDGSFFWIVFHASVTAAPVCPSVHPVLSETWRDFLYIWNKRPLGFKDEVIWIKGQRSLLQHKTHFDHHWDLFVNYDKIWQKCLTG